MSRKDLANREPVNCAVNTKSRLLDEAIEDYLKKHEVKY